MNRFAVLSGQDREVAFGLVLPAPGREKEWFEALPPELQHYLESLGTEKAAFHL